MVKKSPARERMKEGNREADSLSYVEHQGNTNMTYTQGTTQEDKRWHHFPEFHKMHQRPGSAL